MFVEFAIFVIIMQFLCIYLHTFSSSIHLLEPTDPTGCEEGSVRLVDGVIDNEGRVEVCIHGVWGTIESRKGWNYFDAYFVCNQLKLGISKS